MLYISLTHVKVLFRVDVLKKLFIAAFIILFIINCAGMRFSPHYSYTSAPELKATIGRVIPIYVDHTFGEEDRLAINHGIEQWNYALNGHIVLVVEDWNYRVNEEENQKIASRGGFIFIYAISRGDKKNPTRLAFADKILGHRVYFIRDRIESSSDLHLVALHEIGHLLGAGHREHYLMTPKLRREEWQCIDYETLKQVAAAQEFDLATVNYCHYH